MKFTMPVDKVVATKVGHSIAFEKGKPTHVPKEAWPEVQAAGAVPEDGEKVALAHAAKGPDAVVDDPAERKARIFDAYEKLVEKNKRENFTGTGTPTLPAIEGLTGFKVDVKERDALWTEFNQQRD
jgi:hypothetical protein